jgi:hypothetical protein
MTATGRRRAIRYWWLASLGLPLVNPPLVGAIIWVAAGESLGFITIAFVVGAANGLLLWRVSNGIWSAVERRWRVGLGLATAIALSFAFGFCELFGFIWIACHNGGCWG